MTTQNDDLIMNWCGTLRKDRDGERMVIANAVNNYKSRGFTAQQVEDTLIANRYNDKLVEECLREAFAENVAAPKVAQTAVNPTKYSEMKDVIEHSLKNVGANAFVNALTSSEMPIMRVSKSHIATLLRVAQNAYKELHSSQHIKPAVDMLHKDIEPYITSALYDSVVLASKTEGRVFRLAKSDSRFRVTTARETADVDLAAGRSTGKRFSKGHFDMFGLADEHIIRACNVVHPFERLKKAIAEA